LRGAACCRVVAPSTFSRNLLDASPAGGGFGTRTAFRIMVVRARAGGPLQPLLRWSLAGGRVTILLRCGTGCQAVQNARGYLSAEGAGMKDGYLRAQSLISIQMPYANIYLSGGAGGGAVCHGCAAAVKPGLFLRRLPHLPPLHRAPSARTMRRGAMPLLYGFHRLSLFSHLSLHCWQLVKRGILRRISSVLLWRQRFAETPCSGFSARLPVRAPLISHRVWLHVMSSALVRNRRTRRYAPCLPLPCRAAARWCRLRSAARTSTGLRTPVPAAVAIAAFVSGAPPALAAPPLFLRLPRRDVAFCAIAFPACSFPS